MQEVFIHLSCQALHTAPEHRGAAHGHMCYLATSLSRCPLLLLHSFLAKMKRDRTGIGCGHGEDASDRCTRDPMQRPPPPSARRWPTIGYRGFRLGDWGMGIGVPTMDIFISTIWMGSNAFRLELSIEYVCILVTVAVFKIFSFYVMCTNCSCWIFREYL